jgi:probable addiction module antidote protein
LKPSFHSRRRISAALETFPLDESDFIDDSESQAELLAEAMETGNAEYIKHARHRGARTWHGKHAREAGVTREALYKTLSGRGD